MNKISIKGKITLWYTLIMLVISIIALFVMMSVSHDILIRDSAEKLTEAVERVIPMTSASKDFRRNVSGKNHRPINDDFKEIPGYRYFDNGVHTAVYDADGSIIGGAIPFEFADEISFIDGVIQEKNFDGSGFLIYTKQLYLDDDNASWVVGVISIADESMMLESVVKTNLILIIVLIFVAAFGGYLILRQAFKPVDKIRTTAKHISESRDLSQRIALPAGKDEIHRLADTFDEMLDKIEKILGKEKQFTSDASHELRTPVAVISSECEYTLECAATLDEAKESVQSIKQQADKMSKLIYELLAISRMDKDTIAVNLDEVDVSELLNFVCDEQEEIHSENITLTRNIMPNICTTTDSMLLARIFINIISNSYSYGKENGHIEVSLLENDAEIMFKVSDDGIGIAEENLSKIWERFYQVNSSRTNSDSSMGLGLSMVKLIADKLEITPTVKSKLGEGTTFTFIIPKN